MNQNTYNRDYPRRPNEDDNAYKRQRFQSRSPSPFRGQDFRGQDSRTQDFRGQRRGPDRSPSPYMSRSRSNERGSGNYNHNNYGNYSRQNEFHQNKDFSRSNSYAPRKAPVYCPQYGSNDRNSGSYNQRSQHKRVRKDFPEAICREFAFLMSPNVSPQGNRFSQLLEQNGKEREDFLDAIPIN